MGDVRVEDLLQEASVGDGKLGYIAFYNGKELEVWADSALDAQLLAVKTFKPPKSKAHMVHVHLAQKDGKPVLFVPTEEIEAAEQLILRADAVLAEAGFVIEAEGYEDYANALRTFLREGQLTEAQTQELEGIGDVVRKVAHAAGAVKGAHAGVKARWADFKASVKGAFAGGHKKGFDKTSGRKPEPEKEPAKEPAKAAEPDKKVIGGKLRRVKAAKAAAAPAAAPAKKARGAMSDKEYKARYGHARAASRGQKKRKSLKLVASMEALADFTKTTGVNLEAATVAAWEMLASPTMEGGEKFAALSKKLSQKPGVKDPDALAAAIGRKKYGKEKFQKMAAAGRSEELAFCAEGLSIVERAGYALEGDATDPDDVVEALESLARQEGGELAQRVQRFLAPVVAEELGPVIATVPSSSNPAKKYEIRMGHDGNVYCSCPAWRNMKLPPAERVCKHMKSLSKQISTVASKMRKAAGEARDEGKQLEVTDFRRLSGLVSATNGWKLGP